MTAVVIGRGSQVLTLARHGEWSKTDSDNLAVSLVDGGMSAELVVSAGYLDFRGLAAFFSDLASAWRGWEGELLYESLEHDLILRATHRGRVRLAVQLRETEVDGWSVHSVLSIEPGEELSQISTDVTELIRRKSPKNSLKSSATNREKSTICPNEKD